VVSFPACPGSQPKAVVYDLTERVAVAERWSARDVILFGTPAAEPNQAEGFYHEAGGARGDSFAWVGREAEVSLTWPKPAPRAAVVDIAPYRGLKGQAADVLLNGARAAHLVLNDLRYRYAVPLPEAAQRAGDNRLRFVFASTAAPADADPKNADKRQLAAAFYSLAVGARPDAALDDLLGRDAARPFAITGAPGVPTVTAVGPGVLRYALRLPAGAELRFTPELHPAARTAAASASFRVTLEVAGGREREIWGRVLGPQDRTPAEVTLPLPGSPGEIVRLGLHVGGAPAERFAWGIWRTPRVLGNGGGESLERPPASAEDNAKADPLRKALAATNVVFVIFDAGRAREYGAYGYGRATTPEVDRIAREGVLFERAFTPAAYTLGAMSSVWTSQYPDRHHSEVSFSARLPKDRLTLAELLSGRGVATAGFVANAVAGTAFGFDRGFSEFREIFRELGSAASGFPKVLPAWLDARQGQRFFLYLHFREPHFPYDPPAPFDTRFGAAGPIPKVARQQTDWITDLNQGRRKPAPGEVEHLVRLYDGNLAFADQQLGLVRKALEERGLWDKSLVIVAADHGEGLFEHGWIGHNVQLYEESIHVPLIVHLPKGAGPAGVKIKGLVDLLDIAPTIADAFGALGGGASERAFEGRSLLPMLAGAPGKPIVLSRTVWDRPRYALRDERFKFLYDTRTGEQELYDIGADPGETHNLAGQEPVRVAYYRQTLHHWIAALGRRGVSAGTDVEKLTPEQCENMRSLGYVQSCK
jgi:arylsulfatase A-like enzyme